MSEYAMNPFDHLAPYDGPYPKVAMPHPFNRHPIFSTMGRGPRGEKGDVGFIEFADPIEHDKNRSYESGVIVLGSDNVSYLSKQDVPVGIELSDERYWGVTATPSAQVEEYRQEVQDLTEIVESIQEKENSANFGIAAIAKNNAIDAENATDFWVYQSVDGQHFDRKVKLTGISGYSSSLCKIGDYYYHTNGKQYQYSRDLVNWSESNVFDIPEIEAVDDTWWAGSIVNAEQLDKILYMVSYQYSDSEFVNGLGITETSNHRAVFFEITQNEDGTLNKVTTAQNIGVTGTSYIDPVAVYHDTLGFVLAIKNEYETTIEVYSGTSLQSLTKRDILAPLYGIEAPQLIQANNSVFLYCDGYDPQVISYHEEGYEHSSTLGINALQQGIFGTMIVNNGSLVNYALWNLIDFGNTVTHPGYVVLDSENANILASYPTAPKSHFYQRYNFRTRSISGNDVEADNPNYIRFTNVPGQPNYFIGGMPTSTDLTVEFKPLFNCTENLRLNILTSTGLAVPIKCGAGFSKIGITNPKINYTAPSGQVPPAIPMTFYTYNPNNIAGSTLVAPIINNS